MCIALALAVSLHAIEPPKPTEKWVALEAENFRFVSAVPARQTSEIARDLLRLRAALGKVSDLELHTAEPTHVIVFRTQQRFRQYCAALLRSKCDPFTGLFVQGSSGDFILLPGDATGGVDRVVYHELTHQLVANTSSTLPLWFNEGLAEYFSTFRTAGTEVHLGVTVDAHLQWLRDEVRLGSLRKRLIPLRDLFAVTAASPIYNEGTRTGVFYAQSWALVHYLTHNRDRRDHVPKFLRLLRSGQSPDDAVAGAFGMSLSELEQALRTYIRGDTFNYYGHDVGELPIPELPDPSPMPHDTVLHELGALLMHVPESRPTAERFFLESIAANERNAAAYGRLARLYQVTGRMAEADAAYAKAVELGSDDAMVYLLAGDRLLRRQELARARPLFQRATELDPKSALAWGGLGATYLRDESNRAAGIAALEKSLALDPANEEAAFYLAQLWGNEGQFDAARKLARSLLSRTKNELLKEQTTAVLATIDRQESAAVWKKSQESTQQALEWIVQAVEKVNAGKYAEALALVEAALPKLPNEQSRKKALDLRDLIAAQLGKR